MESAQENRLTPLDEMIRRARRASLDSESAHLDDLLTLSEMVLKLATLGMLAGLNSEYRENRYALEYSLVRADSLGPYWRCLNELINGQTRRGLDHQAALIQADLNTRGGTEASDWPEEALHYLFEARDALKMEPIKDRRKGSQWFELLPQLRNRVKHGSPTLGQKARVVGPLESSLDSVIDGFLLFSLPWLYQYQKANGELVTLPLTPGASALSHSVPQRAGVYVVFDQTRRAPLLDSDPDLRHFWFPNGNYRSGRYEQLAYVDDSTRNITTDSYERPPVPLPKSETQGLGSLELEGDVFTNLPSLPRGYVRRGELEDDLGQLILDQSRHPIITLHGSGGLGKTSLALAVLHGVTSLDAFDAILWFSARDVDLLPERPTKVARHLATASEIADEVTRLLEPKESAKEDYDSLEFCSELLSSGLEGGPLLFVFDNFETVDHPVELFNWISTHIRLPNKAIVTTRHRQFKADYPIEVTGMEAQEFEVLVGRVAAELDLDDDAIGDREELYRETGGSPYIAKVVLGQLSLPGNLTRKPRLLVAKRADVLEALFSESFSQLPEDGQRIFLILGQCLEVPLIALEAVLSRSAAPAVDVDAGLEPLVNLALVSVDDSAGADDIYVAIQVTAARFAQRKLKVSPLRALVEGDVELLRMFGDRPSRAGVAAQFDRFRRAATQKVRRAADLAEPRDVMYAAASSQPDLWLVYADFLEEVGSRGVGTDDVADALRRYLEFQPDDGQVMKRLADLYHARGDSPQEEVQLLIERASLPDTPIEEVSRAASRFLAENRSAREAGTQSSVEWMSKSARDWTVRRILSVMDRRASEAGARECATAAWLCISNKDFSAAHQWIERGLEVDPNNKQLLDLKSLPTGGKGRKPTEQSSSQVRVPMSNLLAIGARRRGQGQGDPGNADQVRDSVVALLEDMLQHPRLSARLHSDGVTLAEFGQAFYAAVPNCEPRSLGFTNLRSLVESAISESPFAVVTVNEHPRLVYQAG